MTNSYSITTKKHHSSSSDFNYIGVCYTAVDGAIIGFLFFVLYLSLLARIRANKIAEQFTDNIHISEEKHRHLIENIQNIIFTIDKNSIISLVLPSWKSLLGYSAEEEIVLSFCKRIVDKHYEKMWAELEQRNRNCFLC